MELKPVDYSNIARSCVGLQLRKASRSVTQFFDEALRPSGLRITQFPVLVRLSIASPATITSVAEDLLMDRTSLTRLLKPLETGAMIRVSSGRDQRTRELSLTTHGRQKLADAIPHWQKAQAHIVKQLGQERWGDLRQALLATVWTVQKN